MQNNLYPNLMGDVRTEYVLAITKEQWLKQEKNV